MNTKSEKLSSIANRSLPSFHCGFIALTPTSDKSWSVPVRAKPCETQSFTQSLIAEVVSNFAIYPVEVTPPNTWQVFKNALGILAAGGAACNMSAARSAVW